MPAWCLFNRDPARLIESLQRLQEELKPIANSIFEEHQKTPLVPHATRDIPPRTAPEAHLAKALSIINTRIVPAFAGLLGAYLPPIDFVAITPSQYQKSLATAYLGYDPAGRLPRINKGISFLDPKARATLSPLELVRTIMHEIAHVITYYQWEIYTTYFGALQEPSVELGIPRRLVSRFDYPYHPLIPENRLVLDDNNYPSRESYPYTLQEIDAVLLEIITQRILLNSIDAPSLFSTSPRDYDDILREFQRLARIRKAQYAYWGLNSRMLCKLLPIYCLHQQNRKALERTVAALLPHLIKAAAHIYKAAELTSWRIDRD